MTNDHVYGALNSSPWTAESFGGCTGCARRAELLKSARDELGRRVRVIIDHYFISRIRNHMSKDS